MAGSFNEAFKNVDLSNLADDVEINTNQIENDMKIEFYEKYIKMIERKASQKELHHFATDNGFVSILHMNMVILLEDEIDSAYDELDDALDYFDHKKCNELREKINRLTGALNIIKTKRGYKCFMILSGEKDISPYGVDLLRKI